MEGIKPKSPMKVKQSCFLQRQDINTSLGRWYILQLLQNLSPNLNNLSNALIRQ